MGEGFVDGGLLVPGGSAGGASTTTGIGIGTGSISEANCWTMGAVC